ncbi:MAG: hypothetical protein JXP34_23135 [Planctomycetes bacterium]|nr:hypothetical protein [Planctomycetota bacterium]
METRRIRGSGRLFALAISVSLLAAATPVAADLLIDCGPAAGGGGDGISRGFYIGEYPGTTLSRVDLWISASVAGTYTLSLTARAGAYNGAVIGTDNASVTLTANTSANVRTQFDFSGAPAVSTGSTVAFILAKVSGPSGALYYQTTTAGGCTTVTQTTGTSPPLDSFRRAGIAIRVYGSSGPDLRADRLEVTQAIQNLTNSVRLVSGKRTFVRFHVSSASGNYATYAQLTAQRTIMLPPGPIVFRSTLAPLNGTITVRPSPDRAQLNHAFLFELPALYTSGNVTLTGSLNPVTDTRTRDPVEGSYTNNEKTVSVSYEFVPSVNLVIYRVGYKASASGNTYYPPSWHRDQLVDWLRREYPASTINVWNRTVYFGDHRPSCTEVNSLLATKRIYDLILSIFGIGTIPTNAHYYGMVDDRGGFMRGCAADIPAFMAAGPTGTDTWGWDTDGSYGDWYGAHELGHTFGRYHAMFCGAGGGVAYPYANGQISTATTGDNAFYGFDIGTHAIYAPPTWRDLMTYCDYEWISDFSYHGLMDFFQDNLSKGKMEMIEAEGEGLLVVGSMDPDGGNFQLQPTKYFERAPLPIRRQGNYAIVLLDRLGKELASYPFEPVTAEYGPPIDPKNPGTERILINEVVPFVKGTARINIEGPKGLLAFHRAGLGVPKVTLLKPNGGQTLDGDPITVSWQASDPDGDPLHFSILYTPDGEAWETVAVDLEGTSVEIDAVNIPAGGHAIFRVVASDGIYSASDDSDAPNVVPNRPPTVRIIEPAGDIVVAYGQTVALEGKAYDIDDGTLEGDSLEWSSSIGGALGTGSVLAVGDLGIGDHTITLKATDSMKGVATDTVHVKVVLTLRDITLQLDGVTVTPTDLTLYPLRGETTATIAIDNRIRGRSISWTADPAADWIQIEPEKGTTPAKAIVTVSGKMLTPGLHTSSLRITSPGAGQATVNVQAFIQRLIIIDTDFIRGDSNDDGQLDLADAIYSLGCLFDPLSPCPKCLDTIDANDDGLLNLADPIYFLSYYFVSGPAPKPPFPRCGADPTADDLGSCSYSHCP